MKCCSFQITAVAGAVGVYPCMCAAWLKRSIGGKVNCVCPEVVIGWNHKGSYIEDVIGWCVEG